jgi:hypothetical protein
MTSTKSTDFIKINITIKLSIALPSPSYNGTNLLREKNTGGSFENDTNLIL